MANETAEIMMGPVVLWYAPLAEAIPNENSVAFGADWGGNWKKVGLTKAALNSNYSFDVVAARVQEALADVKRRKSAEALIFETVLAQISAANLQLAGGGILTLTAAGAAQVAKEELAIGNNPVLTERAWGIEGEHHKDDGTSYPARLFIYRGTAQFNGALEFSKEIDGTGLPIQIHAMHDFSKTTGSNLCLWQRVTAPHI